MRGELFRERVAIVTGAASGIGLAVAERFAEEGATVALLDCDKDKGKAVTEQMRSQSASCEFFPADVTSEKQIYEAVTAIAGTFGRVDHLVNSAGITLVKSIEECSVEEWDRVLNVNARSLFLLAKHCLPFLRCSPNASIVNISSVSSLVAQKKTPAYVASKGAALMLSKALALDLAEDGIRVNSVCPGITDTPMLRLHINASQDPERKLAERCARVPMGRMLSPREIADAVIYLSSDLASGITGTELVVDGGYIAAAEWAPG